MSRSEAYRMIRRRAVDAGVFAPVCCHSFRATGITVYLENNGTLEMAQKIAAHESLRKGPFLFLRSFAHAQFMYNSRQGEFGGVPVPIPYPSFYGANRLDSL